MKTNIWTKILCVFAFSVSSVYAQSLARPFDGRRLDADITTLPSTSSSKKLSVPARKGVFCGLLGDLDQLLICVDESWVSPGEFSARAGTKVVWANHISIKLLSGKIVVIGDVLPKWKQSLKKGSLK